MIYDKDYMYFYCMNFNRYKNYLFLFSKITKIKFNYFFLIFTFTLLSFLRLNLQFIVYILIPVFYHFIKI